MNQQVTAALCFVATLALGVARSGQAGEDTVRARAQPVAAAALGVGALVEDLAYEDIDGKHGRLGDAQGAKALVIAFTNVSCPVCKRYGPRLGWFSREHADDVHFLFVNPSPQEDPAAIRAAIEAFDLKGRYVHDAERALTRALGARTTAEVFVLDAARTLIYRGAVDDQYGVGYVLERPRRHYLRDALDAVRAGRLPATPATTAPGCVLRLSPRGGASKRTDTTWHAHMSRIVQRRCQSCHRPGENAPFPLMTHADVKGNAGMIRWAVAERVMPPWFAGEKSLACGNDPRLTDEERARVLAWIDADCPEGDPADAPLPRTWVTGWKIGTPDAVIEIPRPFEIPAEGVIPYRNVSVPTDFGSDRWIEAFEIRPTAPQVVHHVLVFARYPRAHPRYKEQPRVRNGVAGYFAAMVPGQGAHTFPEGTARFLPKGTTLRFQIHYTTNGTPATDRTRLGLIFHDGKPRHEMRSTGIYNLRLRIPPGAENHREGASRMLPIRGRVYGFTPHMHVRGKAFRYEARYPDRRLETLLDIPRYDFNWQLTYSLAEPLDMPAGTRVIVTGWYDNSEKNPANPDPTKLVRWGDQTWDEMLIGYVDWHPLTSEDGE